MSNNKLKVQICPRICYVHQRTCQMRCSNIGKVMTSGNCSVLDGLDIATLLYSLQFRNHSSHIQSQQIPELHWWQFQSLPCTLLPALSLAGLKLLPGQFSELQLVVMQSQTLPQLNQQCLLGLVTVAGPAQAIEPGNPAICRVNHYVTT